MNNRAMKANMSNPNRILSSEQKHSNAWEYVKVLAEFSFRSETSIVPRKGVTYRPCLVKQPSVEIGVNSLIQLNPYNFIV